MTVRVRLDAPNAAVVCCEETPLNEPGTWGGEHPTRTPGAVCPFPNTGRSRSHGGKPADPGSLNGALIAAAMCCEAMSTTKGSEYPCRNHHRGDVLLPGDRHPSCTLEQLADDAGRPTFPVPTRVASALRRVLPPPARIRGLASRLRRLAGPTVLLLRRPAVSRVDVASRWWYGGCVPLVDPRAGLPRVSAVGR